MIGHNVITVQGCPVPLPEVVGLELDLGGRNALAQAVVAQALADADLLDGYNAGVIDGEDLEVMAGAVIQGVARLVGVDPSTIEIKAIAVIGAADDSEEGHALAVEWTGRRFDAALAEALAGE